MTNAISFRPRYDNKTVSEDKWLASVTYARIAFLRLRVPLHYLSRALLAWSLSIDCPTATLDIAGLLVKLLGRDKLLPIT